MTPWFACRSSMNRRASRTMALAAARPAGPRISRTGPNVALTTGWETRWSQGREADRRRPLAGPSAGSKKEGPVAAPQKLLRASSVVPGHRLLTPQSLLVPKKLFSFRTTGTPSGPGYTDTPVTKLPTKALRMISGPRCCELVAVAVDHQAPAIAHDDGCWRCETAPQLARMPFSLPMTLLPVTRWVAIEPVAIPVWLPLAVLPASSTYPAGL